MAVKTATAVKKVRELSEEDVLKAPDKDYMNEAQLAFFKRKLIELRDQLLQNADDTGEHLRENEVTTDPSDRATLEDEPILLSLQPRHLRVGSPGDEVQHLGMTLDDPRESRDRRLDALSWGDEPERRENKTGLETIEPT